MPGPPEHQDQPLIMVVGMGDLSTRLLNMLLADPATSRLVLAGRDVDAIRRRANLARFAAMNLGVIGRTEVKHVDLNNVAATAEAIAEARPEIIFMGATLQSWRVITELPKEVFAELDEAQLGPWLPMHLTLNYLLMQAVRMSGVDTKVVNAAFPDAVGPVLAKVGLAPAIGIGNVANIIPALKCGFAHAAGADPADVELRLVAQHYFSHYVPRFGNSGDGAYHLTVRIRGEQVGDEIDHADVFRQLRTRLQRLGGLEGQLLTASSAMRVLSAMATDSKILAHAPAPNGLPGGYPVLVGRDGGVIDLDASLTIEEAIRINEAGQHADGIAHIDDEGTVTFTEPEMAVMKRMLGYECRTMKLSESAEWAHELDGKYRAFAAQYKRCDD
jgi:hypothetical protein